MTKKVNVKGEARKEGGILMLDHQAVTHPDTVKGEDVDVRTLDAATIVCFHAPVEAIANTNPGKFLIQISGLTSESTDWATIATHSAGVVTAATEALTGAEASQGTALGVASTAGFASEDLLYIQDVSDIENSEWEICQKIVGSTSIDIIHGLSRAKEAGDVIWNNAEIFVTQIDLISVVRVRVIFMHEGTAGANVHVRALMTVGDRD